ncbi:DUF1636 family protein [Paracoccus sphaerophysae]|uniref:Metal-binding protein n=1 Tax=Paracoccus sphaerophysae TaxID=690417 RepID=A0A099FEN4_9RHOB|nr:DUF1636 domain-containing protein [Paracoccus sphaerophysae]KGJ08666.1 metal-binding protein [Paracoccus sphaerophysae]
MGERSSQVELLVCTRCRRGDLPDGDCDRPGARLFGAVAALSLADVRVVPVECLSNCNRGCTIALRAPGRWTYVYGELDDGADLDAIRDGTAAYVAAPDGLVPWRDRPAHFRKNCIARIPPMGTL